MHCIWKTGRISATAGGRASTWLVKAQSAADLRSEQFADVDGISWMHRSLVACAPYFSRSFSAESIEESKNEIPRSKMNESKLNGILALCEGKSWDASVEEALGAYSKKLSRTLVYKAVERMESDNAKEFFKWAGKQGAFEPASYLYNMLFRNFLRAGKFKGAIEILQEMKDNDVAINIKSFSSLAYFYVKAGMRTEAEKTIGTMKSFGFSPTMKLYRILLSGYLQAGDEEGAERIVQELSGTEEFNAALSVNAAMGRADLALNLLAYMENKKCLSNVRTYDLLVQCLCRANRFEEALKFLDNMQEKGLRPVVVYNTLISYLFQENRVDEALKLFLKMKDTGCEPDIETHNTLIAGYLHVGQTEKAQKHLEVMKAGGSKPTRSTLKLFRTIRGKGEEVEEIAISNLSVKSSDLSVKSKKKVSTVSQQESKDGKKDNQLDEKQDKKLKRILEICKGKSWDADIEEALSGYSKDLTRRLVHKLLKKMEADLAKGFFKWSEKQEGYTHSKHEYTVLFRNLLSASKFDSAIEVLKKMKENDLEIDPKCFSSLVHFYGKAGMMAEAEKAVEMVESFGFTPDAKLYGALMNGYLRANNDESATRILQDCSDVEDFNAAISAYARAGKADSALKVLKMMEQKGCPPNVQTYDLLVRCLCRAEMIEEALKALENMQEKDLVQEVRVYNTLISYYCQVKRVDEALKLISKMKEFGCQPDIITHNSLITGYLKSGQIEKAHQHVEEMKTEGCTPTHETSRLFVVNLCMHKEVDKAMQKFTAAVENDQKLSPDACNSLLKGLIKVGKVDEALKVFERMKEAACHADIRTYVVLLRGCCNLYKFDVMEQLLAEVRDKNFQLPVSTYVVLLQTYSRAKKFKEVVALFEGLQESGQDYAGAKTSTAVLDALSRAHQLDLGVKFCEFLANSGAKVNSRQLKYFLRLLVRKGRAGEATELMKALSEKSCVIPEKSQA